MAVDITWLFSFNTFEEKRGANLYEDWLRANESFKDFYDRFRFSAWGGSGNAPYPIIATRTIDNKKVKGFGTWAGNYSGIQFMHNLPRDLNKRTYFGYRLTSKWCRGNLFDFSKPNITTPDGKNVLPPLTVAELGLEGATSSIYIEQVLTPNYSDSTLINHKYELFINGIIHRTGIVPNTDNKVNPCVGAYGDGRVFGYGINFLISDCYEGEQVATEELAPFGSLEVTGHPVTNISNDNSMTLQGSTATNVVEEMNLYWDPRTLKDKTSSVLLSNMGIENIFSFEEVTSSVVGATIRTTYNRGNSAFGRVSLTPITSSGAGESLVFIPPTEVSKDFTVKNIPLKGELTAAEVNAFKVKVSTVR